MRRSQSVALSILISHQHLLHPSQPLPPSPSGISSVSGLADCRAFLSDAPASHHCQRNYETAGSLRSLGITPVHRYFEPFRHLLAFLPFPGSAGYRSDLLQSLSLWDEEGFSSCLTCPCHRAAPTTPPKWHVASVSPRHVMLPSPRTRGLGLRIFVLFRGHLWVYLRCGPVTRSPSFRWLCRPASPVSLSSAGATQAKGLLTFAPVGLLPTEHICFPWTPSLVKMLSRANAIEISDT